MPEEEAVPLVDHPNCVTPTQIMQRPAEVMREIPSVAALSDSQDFPDNDGKGHELEHPEISQWYVPTKYTGILPEEVEKMLN